MLDGSCSTADSDNTSYIRADEWYACIPLFPWKLSEDWCRQSAPKFDIMIPMRTGAGVARSKSSRDQCNPPAPVPEPVQPNFTVFAFSQPKGGKCYKCKSCWWRQISSKPDFTLTWQKLRVTVTVIGHPWPLALGLTISCCTPQQWMTWCPQKFKRLKKVHVGIFQHPWNILSIGLRELSSTIWGCQSSWS